MKQVTSMNDDNEMLEEYDFSEGVRGKYAGRAVAGRKVVTLAPDVAEVFPDSASVNEALRVLIRVARQSANAAVHKSDAPAS